MGRGKQRRSFVSCAFRADEMGGLGPVRLAAEYTSLMELSMLLISFSKSAVLIRALEVMLAMLR